MHNLPTENSADDKVWTNALGLSPKRDFACRVCNPTAAMVKKESQDGHRAWTQFNPATFSKEEWKVVEGMWDHEHCAICWLRISTGDAYWQNSQNFILCPNCYAAFQKRSQQNSVN